MVVGGRAHRPREWLKTTPSMAAILNVQAGLIKTLHIGALNQKLDAMLGAGILRGHWGFFCHMLDVELDQRECYLLQ